MYNICDGCIRRNLYQADADRRRQIHPADGQSIQDADVYGGPLEGWRDDRGIALLGQSNIYESDRTRQIRQT
jgi:hypothetical protein